MQFNTYIKSHNMLKFKKNSSTNFDKREVPPFLGQKNQIWNYTISNIR